MISVLFFLFTIPLAVGTFMICYGLLGWRWEKVGRPGTYSHRGPLERNYQFLLRRGGITFLASLPFVVVLGQFMRAG